MRHHAILSFSPVGEKVPEGRMRGYTLAATELRQGACISYGEKSQARRRGATRRRAANPNGVSLCGAPPDLWHPVGVQLSRANRYPGCAARPWATLFNRVAVVLHGWNVELDPQPVLPRVWTASLRCLGCYRREASTQGRQAQTMDQKRSCGFLIWRASPNKQFLLMEHPNRWDLPKGHVDPGENDEQCALRELEEETGIQRADLQIDDLFRFRSEYEVCYRGQQPAWKTLIIFLAELTTDRDLVITEHRGYRWFEWTPPHTIQVNTIDPLLESIANHWDDRTTA